MFKTILIPLVLQFLILTNGSDPSQGIFTQQDREIQTGTLEKMMVTNGQVTMDIDVNRLNGLRSRPQIKALQFGIAPDSFFTVLILNNSLRGPLPGSMKLMPENYPALPLVMQASLNQLVIEKVDGSQPFDIVVRDSKTGFILFNVEGNSYDYDPKTTSLDIKEGRLVLSKEYAIKLGRPADENTSIGTISITASMRPIEVTQVVNGEARSVVLPPLGAANGAAAPNANNGPDVIVGDLPALVQSGSSGSQVGLAVATTSCNLGNVELDWFQLPNNDHPVIPQNLYRLSGGANNDDRFEQIGQSWLKHAFTALQETVCGPCSPAANGTHLGVGCSDPYSTSLNGGQNSLGSRAWVNPFTGAFPGSGPSPNSHTGHTHNGTSHRILVDVSDLNTTLNPGATYYAEAEYVTPHEYAWCQAHSGQCNMYNNASYRRFNVTGTSSFTFSPAETTVQSKPAITAWPNATVNTFEPAPGTDGTGIVAYRVTNPSPGVWHYEYAIYNQNLDRGIQSFTVPIGPGVTISNIGFHAPNQAPGFANDGTVGDAGYSSTAWAASQTSNSLTWNTETFGQNPNANAIRWGTLYNFRFDANGPPQNGSGSLGFFKTGSPMPVQVQGPVTTQPIISINDVTLSEGNAGTKLATFTVSLSPSSTDSISVDYATADGVATAGSDYTSTSGTLTFLPGQVTQPVSVTINGDSLEEPNETFFVNLSNATNSVIGDAQGQGTITNDDLLATLPVGFVETQINGLSNATAMALHPDGRVFVCEQGGSLRVIKNGALLPTSFTTISVNSSGERGLLGVAFDPNYATNRFVYVYYTTSGAPIHNRVSRFTADIANQDVATAGSEVVLLDLDNLSGATNHNGGAIHFGPDGKLYIAVGENANSANSQTLSNLLGKVLRMNADGTIPADNPFFGTATGQNRLIWAMGLRNPFTFDFQPGTGRLHINDVGQSTWEEINNGVAGVNYGWPTCEGVCGTVGMTNPIYQYSHDGSTCAIAGGSFYNPTTLSFPGQYVGKYFFADLCAGWIKVMDPLSPPATSTAANFITGISSPVDIHTANDGSMYYLARGTNSVFRVQYTGGPQLAINDLTITEGNAGTSTANFTVTLAPASNQAVSVQYATANNTAFAGTDYVAAIGTVNFAPGQTSQPVSVTINGDTTFEPNETFNVNLSNAVNASIGDAQGAGTISNDDPQPTISINDAAVTEGNTGTTTLTFTVSLSNPSSQTISANYATAANTATSGTDFLAGSGTVTITPGLLSAPVSVTVNGDTIFEPNETFFLNLSTPVNATINDSQGLGTITNDDTQPTISINDMSVNEGNAGTTIANFSVTLSSASTQTITVDYATADNTATGGNDYVAKTGTVTFTPGLTSQPVSVTVNGDTTFEINETFFVNLSNAANATIADNQSIGTITNDDGQPGISINDVSVTEGNIGATLATFAVSLSNASSQTITVNYATAPNSASAGTDYATTSGTLTFNPGQTSQPVSVTVNGDTLNEINESFFVNLSAPANASIADSQGLGTINNDDPQPSLSINDVTVVEGSSGSTTATFTVSLSAASGQTVSVNYATANGTALAGNDYTATNGTVTFAPGQITQPVNVTVAADTFNEPNETFFVNLSVPSNATISDNQGLGTITDDDAQPTLSVGDIVVTEGNAGTVNAVFTVALSPASQNTVTVQYSTSDGTASVSDYASATGTLTFTPGQISQPISVTVNGDTLSEANETFFVNLTNPTNATISDGQATGTINDDDALPSLSIDDVSLAEGNTGTSAAVFTVTLSAVSGQTVTVNFNTADGSAASGSDYAASTGTLSFAPGVLTRTIPITVNGDTALELNENFFVNLLNPTAATIVDNQGQGTILNDDLVPPSFEFTQANFDQPEGIRSLQVTVKRNGDPGPAAAVDFQTIDAPGFVECSVINGLANQRCDYLLTSGTLSFAPNEVQKSFRLIINNDVYQEGNEIINLSLSNPSGSGAQLGPQSTATVTIVDDDAGTPTTNPIDDARFFVRQHYSDFLQRLPDQAGEDYWTGIITSCGADPACINNNRITVSNAFFFEPEYQQTAAYVVRMYRIAFGNDQPFRNPDSSDLTEAKKIVNYGVFVKDRARVVGGANLAQSQLNLANAFVQRTEFLTKYPASLTGPDFVDALLLTVNGDLGVDLASQRDALIALFDSGGRGNVLYRLADDNVATNPINNGALIDVEYNRTLVFTEYAGYLRRNADINGFKFWLNQVNAFPVRNVNIQHAMVCSFITSQEYQQRFSLVFSRTNSSCQ